MSDSPQEAPLSPQEFRRSWRLVTVAGALGTAYYILCVSGAPRVKYLTHLHATAFHFGVIAALSSLALSFQMLSGILDNHIRRRKPWWIALAITHRLVFLGVLAAPSLFITAHARIWWIILVLCFHDALAHLGMPMWFSWMADIVPRDALNRHWARRQRFTTGASIVASILLAFSFHWFEESGRIVCGFTVVGLVGVVLGLADILLFLAVPEAPHDKGGHLGLGRSLLQPLRDPQFRPFVLFCSYYYFAIFISWPFFTLYMVDSLKVSARAVQLMLAAGPLGVILSTRFWGLLCDTYGQRPALQMALGGKAVFPLAFLLAPPIPSLAVGILSASMFLDGLIDAGMALSIQGVMLKHSPRRNRPMYIAATNFFSLGLMAGLAPLIGGSLIEALRGVSWRAGAYVFGGFHVVFAISLLMRAGAFVLATRLHEPQSVPLGTVLRHLFATNPMRVARALWRLNEAPGHGQRAEAAKRLGELRSPLAIRDLIRSLEDKSALVRDAAAEALGRIGTAEASEPLAAALCDPASGLRSQAARVLGMIGDITSVKALLNNMAGLDRELLGEVVDSLGRAGDWSAMLPLICLFDQVDDPLLRRKISMALGRLSEIRSVDEVMELLSQGRSSNWKQLHNL